MKIPKSNDAETFVPARAIRRYLLAAAAVAVPLCIGALEVGVSAPSESSTGQVEATQQSQADEEIRAAREALREVVTRRQEAMLILMGHLD